MLTLTLDLCKMNDQYSFSNIDSLLLQCAVQTRELSQKKSAINQQIKVCAADIAERKSYIETVQSHIKKLDEEIRKMQSTVIHNKANAKSMKATNTLLHQYEQTLIEELESRKASYNNDMVVYEERIASYKRTFEMHKEYYCQNPLAQKLLALQAEKGEIESRIEACSDEISMKWTELNQLTGPAVSSSSTAARSDSVSGQQPIKEPEKQFDPHTEDDNDSSIDISSLHLNHTEPEQIAQKEQETSGDANAEEIPEAAIALDKSACSPVPEEAGSELWSCQRVDEEISQDEMDTEERDRETEPDDHLLDTGASSRIQEHHSAVSGVVETVEEMEESAAVDEEEAPSEEDNEGVAAVPRSASQETNPQSHPEPVKAVPSTPVFPFNSSPNGSPHQETSDSKSPAFPFSLNSGPSTPGFAGFGLDGGSSQDEDSSFSFTGCFFNEKKTTESKSSSCPEFLFGQADQSEDFQFVFTSKSPQTTDKDGTGDDFPFSFNF